MSELEGKKKVEILHVPKDSVFNPPVLREKLSTRFEYKWYYYFICLSVYLLILVFLFSLCCPGTHFVGLTGLELRNPPASSC